MKKKDLVFDNSKVISSKAVQIKIVVKKAVIMAKTVEGNTTTKTVRKIVE